jgi:hypothetical protein
VPVHGFLSMASFPWLPSKAICSSVNRFRFMLGLQTEPEIYALRSPFAWIRIRV